jgi:hypothetical protein
MRIAAKVIEQGADFTGLFYSWMAAVGVFPQARSIRVGGFWNYSCFLIHSLLLFPYNSRP